MSFTRSPIILLLFICIVTIYSLFSIKESVAGMRYELSQVNLQLQQESDTIHLLKAELAYLTSPTRLREINDQYLHLEPIQIAQVVKDPILAPKSRELMLAEAKPIMHNSHDKVVKNIKWRFKKGASKYLTVASCTKQSCKKNSKR